MPSRWSARVKVEVELVGLVGLVVDIYGDRGSGTEYRSKLKRRGGGEVEEGEAKGRPICSTSCTARCRGWTWSTWSRFPSCRRKLFIINRRGRERRTARVSSVALLEACSKPDGQAELTLTEFSPGPSDCTLARLALAERSCCSGLATAG